MRAFITGVNGQDGSYLAELLLSQGYEVLGLIRRSSTPSLDRIDHLFKSGRFNIIEGDVTDAGCMRTIIDDWFPTEVYNLAAQSHVGTSFKQPAYTTDATYLGALNILEALRVHKNVGRDVKFYQASSSEMFGDAVDADGFQRESTPMNPQSPYGIAKLAAHHLTRLYREAYGMFCCSGILFNHESERRGELFVTRKITRWMGRFIVHQSVGLEYPKLRLGDLSTKRDWGHAEDYVRGMYLMLHKSTPGDYVLSTGEIHSIQDFVNYIFVLASNLLNREISPQAHIETDPSLLRPSEVRYLCGDSRKARDLLKWTHKSGFYAIAERMLTHDINLAEKERASRVVQ